MADMGDLENKPEGVVEGWVDRELLPAAFAELWKPLGAGVPNLGALPAEAPDAAKPVLAEGAAAEVAGLNNPEGA